MLKFVAISLTLFAISSLAQVALAGVNIGGCDVGIDGDGFAKGHGEHCTTAADAKTQMTHFANEWGMNIFRITVGWQFLVNYTLGGSLDPTFFATYDNLIHTCLNTGAYCILDVHNYARWEGEIVEQSTEPDGPTDAHLESLWAQLATHYSSESKVIFGIMNEPHDLDIAKWSQTVQKVVTAIRQTGETSQLILLPGTDYESTYTVYTDSGPYLQNITDYDGTKSKLLIEVHQYFQAPGNPPDGEPCATDHVNDQFVPATNWLKQNGRLALLTELGGLNDDNCANIVCSCLDYLIDHADAWMGWTGFAAGGPPGNPYSLSLTPFANGTDRLLVQKCFGPKVKGH